MIIPEVIIYNSLNYFLNVIKSDYDSSINKEDSILYHLFAKDDNGNNILLDDYNYYKQSIAILTRDIENQRKLQFNIGYNPKRVNVPTIHILMPNDSKGNIDTIGHSEEKIYDELNDKMSITKTRSNSSTYYLMITSDNSSEVMIVYYWIKAMFLIFHEEIENLGLRNLNHSGQDINLQQDLAPPNIFHRNLSLNFSYESSVNINIDFNKIKGININSCFCKGQEDSIVNNELEININHGNCINEQLQQ